MRHVFPALLLLAAFGIVSALALGFLGFIHPAFDTFSHLRLHLSIVLTMVAILAVIIRNHWFAGICLAIAGVSFLTTTNGTVLSAKEFAGEKDLPVHHLFHMNLLWKNPNHALVMEQILKHDPLVITLSEFSTTWQATLKQLEPNWPHHVHCPEAGVLGGTKIYSQYPLDPSQDYCGPYGSFMLTLMILEDNSRIAIGSVHPRWPWPASGPDQYRAFAPALRAMGSDGIVAGDFNAVTWSHALRRFAADGGLSIVQGIGASWLVEWLPAAYTRILGLPIDNVMAKGRVRVLSAKTLDNLGSDHLPVLVRFQINP